MKNKIKAASEKPAADGNKASGETGIEREYKGRGRAIGLSSPFD